MVSIVEVLTRAQRRLFVDYPNQLYKDVPQFVPATFDDDMDDWDKKKNPAFEYCEARCWLAMRGDAIVGRIGAILSHRANEKWHTRRMRFTQVDFINDDEVVDALFDMVESWAREKDCTQVHGPLGFTDFDREGMLVEGFDRRSCFFTYYNHSYYVDQLTRRGYAKDVDWVENLITIPRDEPTVRRWRRLSQFVQTRYHLHTVEAKNRLGYLPILTRFFKLVNVCYAPLYGTVELTDAQIKRYAMKFAPLVNPNLSCFVMDEADNMVAMGVAAPSIAAALQKNRGKYLPFGWVDLLRAFRKNDTADLLLIAVLPEYQGKGVNAVVIDKLMRGSEKVGITRAESGPMLELNHKVQEQWKDMDIEQHKRRRCFIKTL